MRRILATLLLPLGVLVGCDRDPVGGAGPVVLLLVAPDDRVLARGETLALEVTARTAGGEAPAQTRIDAMPWSSDDVGIATVAAGIVTGIAPGTTTVRAELDGVAATVRVTVADPAADCADGGMLPALPVGGSATLIGVEARLLCLDGGETGRDYLLVPFHGGSVGGGFVNVLLAASGTTPPVGLHTTREPLPPASTWPRLDHRFHELLRERAERELTPLLGAARGAAAAPPAAEPRLALQLRNPTLGQEVSINTAVVSCDSARMRTGRVVGIGSRSVIVADLQNPTGGLTDAEYAAFGAAFDTLVWPVVTGVFGEPRDIDDNGRVIIFYTRAVNELTPPGSGAYVGGYFHARDLFPTRARDGIAACATSNVAELFYMLVPDPQGTINNNVFTRALVLEKSMGTVAHEFQHLINASRRLYLVGTSHWSEETWLNEALSHAAEELVFYRAAGLQPRSNLTSGNVQFGRPSTAYREFQEENVRRYQRFLNELETQSPYDPSGPGGDDADLATRGAGWSFLRYAMDRRGTPEGPAWKALIDGSTTGLANLHQALGADPRPWFRDWFVSVYADDVISGLHPRHTQPSWHFRSFIQPYPAHVRTLSDGAEAVVRAKAGSGGFARLGVPPGGTGQVQATRTSGLPLPSAVSITVVRTR